MNIEIGFASDDAVDKFGRNTILTGRICNGGLDGLLGQVFPYSMEALHIRFKPRAVGVRTANVEIHCDEKDRPVYRFAIAGNGTGN